MDLLDAHVYRHSSIRESVNGCYLISCGSDSKEILQQYFIFSTFPQLLWLTAVNFNLGESFDRRCKSLTADCNEAIIQHIGIFLVIKSMELQNEIHQSRCLRQLFACWLCRRRVWSLLQLSCGRIIQLQLNILTLSTKIIPDFHAQTGPDRS